VIFVDIGGIVDHHSMSWGERWFLLILVELLTITQWVEVRGDFCWYWWNCWPSLNELRCTSHFNSLSDDQQFHQYQQKSPLILTHWMMVNNSTNINKNHLSPKRIEWWSTIPPISTKITSHFNSLSDGQQFHLLTITQWVELRGDFCWYWWNCWPSLNELRWEVMFVDIGGIVDHHSMSWGERWFLLILVELLTIISTNITSHFNSLSDGQQFHQYQQKSPLSSTHWVMVNNSTNINKNHLSP
jgi:hypothetical protein